MCLFSGKICWLWKELRNVCVSWIGLQEMHLAADKGKNLDDSSRISAVAETQIRCHHWEIAVGLDTVNSKPYKAHIKNCASVHVHPYLSFWKKFKFSWVTTTEPGIQSSKNPYFNVYEDHGSHFFLVLNIYPCYLMTAEFPIRGRKPCWMIFV